MLLWKRPKKPPSFEEKLMPYRREVADLVAAGKPPAFNENAWVSYRKYFSDVQHGKCGFCESYVHATGHGVNEHYRPKGSFSTLVEPGREVEGTSNVLGRRVEPVTDGPLAQGYWWLAYEWTNWLFACTICNSSWKKDLFPLAGTAKPRRPGPGVDDKPLLLNPYGRTEPGRHLSFSETGQIAGKSRKGRETVRTLGLDRESLRRKRGKIARRLYDLLDEALDHLDAGEDPDPSVMRAILEKGAVDEDYAGMVRIIFAEIMPMTWAELEERYGPSWSRYNPV